MTQIYLRNGFPRRLIQDKITDLKKRNFSPSEFRRQRDEDIRNNPHRNHNLILTYSSRRCDTVIQKLLRTVKEITPQFRLNICWRTVKLQTLTTPKLKQSPPLMLRSGCIYKFTCSEKCSKTYIGESKRLLNVRVGEHFQKSRNTAIFQHIKSCEHFENDLNKKLAKNPNARPSEKQKIITEHRQSHFRPIAFNNNYYKRTTIEALMISLYHIGYMNRN